MRKQVKVQRELEVDKEAISYKSAGNIIRSLVNKGSSFENAEAWVEKTFFVVSNEEYTKMELQKAQKCKYMDEV